MAAVSASLFRVAATGAALQPFSAQKLTVASFNGLRAFPALRQRAVVARLAAPCRPIVLAVANPSTLSKVQEIIVDQLACEREKVVPDAKFVDLGADSLDTVEIMMALEEEFKVNFDEDGADQITTVQEAADLIQSVIESAVPK